MRISWVKAVVLFFGVVAAGCLVGYAVRLGDADLTSLSTDRVLDVGGVGLGAEAVVDQVRRADPEPVPDWDGIFLQRPLVDPVPPEPPKIAKLPKPVAAAARPRVTLQMEIKGIAMDDDPEFRRVWIEYRGKRQMLRVGDSVKGHPGSPELAAIEPDKIAFDMGGACREELEFVRRSQNLFQDGGS